MISNKVLGCLILFSALYVLKVEAQNETYGPPKPPVGKRWVMNPDFSDEFNGTSLDNSKWYDYHPTWKGREPGIFLPSQVSVKDGYLQIKGEKLKKDTLVKAYNKTFTYNIAGGAVVSKKSVFLGYYECKVKAAATSMSTTFWFSTGKATEGPNGCDRYSQEWDIQECIGRTGDFPGNFFSNGMNSNGHFWYTDCNKNKHNLIASKAKFSNTELASKDFHVYGGWWKDENSASFYYNHRAPKHIKFYDKIVDKPFNQPMFMRLVCETYPFPWIPLPTDEELADPTKNTVYYDWVRGYKLVDVLKGNVDQTYEENLKIYNESVSFEKVSLNFHASKKVSIPLTYKANQSRKIYIKISKTTDKLKEKWDKKISEKTVQVYAGYGNLKIDFELKEKLSSNEEYKVEAFIADESATKLPKESLDTSLFFFTVQ